MRDGLEFIDTDQHVGPNMETLHAYAGPRLLERICELPVTIGRCGEDGQFAAVDPDHRTVEVIVIWTGQRCRQRHPVVRSAGLHERQHHARRRHPQEQLPDRQPPAIVRRRLSPGCGRGGGVWRGVG